MDVNLISVTRPVGFLQDSTLNENNEALMVYCARVSSAEQTTENYERLIEYCIKNKHWSVFEMVDMTVEIVTSRAISPQILRHRSFSFQEFSQRYAIVESNEIYTGRRQDEKNRQNSISDLDQETQWWFLQAQAEVAALTYTRYKEALQKGIAKECARIVLPLGTQTRLYMKGSVRSWIHYLEVRTAPSTQKEHRDIANEIKKIFERQFPITAQACINNGIWKNGETEI